MVFLRGEVARNLEDQSSAQRRPHAQDLLFREENHFVSSNAYSPLANLQSLMGLVSSEVVNKEVLVKVRPPPGHPFILFLSLITRL